MYTSCFLLSKYLMWILLKALIPCLFENIVGQAKFYITMYVWMRHFKSVKFYKIIWFKFPLRFLEKYFAQFYS